MTQELSYMQLKTANDAREAVNFTEMVFISFHWAQNVDIQIVLISLFLVFIQLRRSKDWSSVKGRY